MLSATILVLTIVSLAVTSSASIPKENVSSNHDSLENIQNTRSTADMMGKNRQNMTTMKMEAANKMQMNKTKCEMETEMKQKANEDTKPMRSHHRQHSDCKNSMHDQYHYPIHKVCCGNTSMLNDSNGMMDPVKRDIRQLCHREVDEKLFKAFNSSQVMSNQERCEHQEMMDQKKHHCFHECVMRYKGMLHEDGSVDFVQIRKEIERRWPMTQWRRELMQKAVDMCERYRYDTTWMEQKNRIMCNPQSMQFMNCIWREIELNCPDDQKSSQRFCNKLREQITSEKSAMNNVPLESIKM